jgi:hypothetical protein
MISRRGSGSALLDKIRADHEKRWSIWRRGPPPKPKLVPAPPPLPKWDIKPLSARLEEAEKYHGLIPAYSLRRIKDIIRKSNADLGEQPTDTLPTILNSNHRKILEIQQAVAHHFKVNKRYLIGRSRKTYLIPIRHIAVYLCRTITPVSAVKIGQMFGGRDHTTIIYAANKIGELIKTDERLAADVAKLTEILRL